MSAPGRDTVLFVCTANRCRSPMAAALLRYRATSSGTVEVASAGFLPGGSPCPQAVLDVMSEVGADLSGHRSRRVSPQLVDSAGLVVAMTRQHLIELAVEFPDGWERFFTIAGLLERAGSFGGRSDGEPLDAWVGRVSAGRVRSELVHLPASGDIPDPIGRPVRTYRRVRDQLDGLVSGLSRLILPS